MSKSVFAVVAGLSGQRLLKAKNLVPLVALTVFGTLFSNHLKTLDPTAIWHTLTTVSLGQWALAALFTMLSFRAVGTYDVLVHKILGTGVRDSAAKRSGIVAIALAQTLGFGAITGAFVRWRCLPELAVTTVARLSAVVSLSFLAALAVIGGLVIPMSGLMAVQSSWLWIGVLAIGGLFILSRLAFRQKWIPHPLTHTLIGSLLGATFLDTAFAAAALWVLWPDPASFHLVFAAYLIALAAGLVSNCPGGLGAFDLTLLGLLHANDASAATAAILAFRVIYYLVPAVLAVLFLIRPQTTELIDAPNHPEGTLARQSAKVAMIQNTPTLILPCWGNGAVYGDLHLPHSLTDMPMYKCSGRQAFAARAAGWSVLRCAEDALIDLNDWTLQGPARRQLRRALKSFSACALHIRPARPSDDLGHVATAWAMSHGQEKGLSMGRYDPDYLNHQQVFVALDGNTAVAFVSFHISDTQWTLDLMRHIDDLPKGTMQALVIAAIDAARHAGVPTLSLAAVPNPAPNLPGAQRVLEKSAGLRRFKSAFAPRWRPLYLCARGPFSLALTMATLAWSIHRPPPLANPPQPNDEDFSFAPTAPPCECVPSP